LSFVFNNLKRRVQLACFACLRMRGAAEQHKQQEGKTRQSSDAEYRRVPDLPRDKVWVRSAEQQPFVVYPVVMGTYLSASNP
jgi:hypothetical protein